MKRKFNWLSKAKRRGLRGKGRWDTQNLDAKENNPIEKERFKTQERRDVSKKS